MLLMFAAPPASAGSAQALVAHSLTLMRSDMLLLRQMGGAGLWLTLTTTAQQHTRQRSSGSSVRQQQQQDGGCDGSQLASAAVLQELKQVSE